jgi:tetratricopeptide (TPR) repeat protein
MAPAGRRCARRRLTGAGRATALLALTTALATAPQMAAAMDIAPLPPDSAARFIAMGNEALVQNQLPQAIRHFQAALELDRRSFPALFNLALAWQQQGAWDQAKRWYEAALTVRPDHPEALSNLGAVAYAAGDWQTAVTRFTAAAEAVGGRGREGAEYLYNLGTAYERLQQWGDARRAYQRALDNEPRHYGASYNLGTLLMGPLDTPSQAELLLRSAAEIRPERPEPLLNLAVLAERRLRPRESELLYDQAVAIATAQAREVLPDLLWRRSGFYDRQVPARKLEMRRDLEALLALQPEYHGAHGRLGMYLAATGDYAAAAEHLSREVDGAAFDAASEIDVECLYQLARIHAEQFRQHDRALDYAARYYRLRPDSLKLQDLKRRMTELGRRSPAGANPAAGDHGHGAPAPGAHGAAPAHGATPAQDHGQHAAPAKHAATGGPGAAHAAPAAHGDAAGHAAPAAHGAGHHP